MTVQVVPQTSALSGLIDRIRQVVRQEMDPERTGASVAVELEPFLGRTDLLSAAQQEPDEDQYRQHVLHVEDDGSFSIVSLVWLPGQRTPIHDHVSWCVVGVHVGEETEIRYDVHADGEDRYLTQSKVSVNPNRSVCAVTPPGDIHEVLNSCASKAMSIHVYGADIGRLGSSIRRRYELPVRQPAS